MMFLASASSYVLLTLPPSDVHSARYLIPCLVSGAILAGRRTAQALALLPKRAVPLTALALAPIAALYLATSISGLDGPARTNPGTVLAAWLKSNDLEAGFGAYWASSIVTVASAGDVTVRPVTGVDGLLRGHAFYSDNDWFKKDYTGAPRRFLVYDPALTWRGVDDAVAETTFGPPDRVEMVYQYRVLIWDEDIGDLVGPPFKER